MLFDTHAHYDDPKFDADRDTVLASLPDQGVSLVVNPGCDLPSSRTAAALAERWPHVYAAAGYHPENCAPCREEDLDVLRDLLKRPKAVAVGEIGLDYYWEENPPRAFQQKVFRDQMASRSWTITGRSSSSARAIWSRKTRRWCSREGFSSQ